MTHLLLKPAIFLCCCIIPGLLLIRRRVHRRALMAGIDAPPGAQAILILFLVYVSLVLELTILPASISGFNNPPEPAVNAVPVANTYMQFMATLAEPDRTILTSPWKITLLTCSCFYRWAYFCPAFFLPSTP